MNKRLLAAITALMLIGTGMPAFAQANPNIVEPNETVKAAPPPVAATTVQLDALAAIVNNLATTVGTGFAADKARLDLLDRQIGNAQQTMLQTDKRATELEKRATAMEASLAKVVGADGKIANLDAKAEGLQKAIEAIQKRLPVADVSEKVDPPGKPPVLELGDPSAVVAERSQLVWPKGWSAL